MKNFGHFIVEKKFLILIIAVLLLIPSFFGVVYTDINYDILQYLPSDLDSMKGQDVLDKQFNSASIGMLVMKKMDTSQILKLKQEIAVVNGVQQVIFITDFVDASIPKDILPSDLTNVFYSKNSTLMLIKFVQPATSDVTQKAIGKIDDIVGDKAKLGGLSAIQKDTLDKVNKEKPLYVLMAGGLIALVLALFMDSFLIPVIFLLGILFPVMYNMGTNVFFSDISYPTKAMTAPLQMGVTMDFSIFLYNRYEKEKHIFASKEEAMAQAISSMLLPIGASCLTTMAGFLSMLTMKITLGGDIGLIMAKGVFFGLICSLTVLPALILMFDGATTKLSHRSFLPSFKLTSNFITKYYKILIVLFVILCIPAFWGNQKTNDRVYKDLINTLPGDLKAVQATNQLKGDFHMTTSHFIVIRQSTPSYKVKAMMDEIGKVKGVYNTASSDTLVGPGVPDDFIPQNIRSLYSNDKYRLALVNSIYKAASDDEDTQINEIKDIVEKYDSEALVTGEGVLTKDLVNVVNDDFTRVDNTSIIAIFILLALVFGSITIPIVLVVCVELAVFLTMAQAYFIDQKLPFISGIVISCVILGATVNYAILMVTRFREELNNGHDKFEAIRITIQHSAKSVIVSGLCFFGATLGVGIVTKFKLIRTLCFLVSKGAIISTITIIIMLPAWLLATEGIISKTTAFWTKKADIKSINEIEERLKC